MSFTISYFLFYIFKFLKKNVIVSYNYMKYTGITEGHKHTIEPKKKIRIRKKKVVKKEPIKKKVVKKKIVKQLKDMTIKEKSKIGIASNYGKEEPQKKVIKKKVVKKVVKKKVEVDFYKRTGYTRPADLPPPLDKFIKLPPPPPRKPSKARVKNIKVYKVIKKELKKPKSDKEPKADKEPPRPKAKAKAQAKQVRAKPVKPKKEDEDEFLTLTKEEEASRYKSPSEIKKIKEQKDEKEDFEKNLKVKPLKTPIDGGEVIRNGEKIGKTIRTLYPKYINNVVKLVKDGLISKDTRLQKLQFLGVVDIHNRINSGMNTFSMFGRDELLDKDIYDRYTILFKDVKSYVDNVNKLIKETYDNIENVNRDVRKAGSSVLNGADQEIQQRFYDKSRKKYLKYVSDSADKLGVKVAKRDEDNAKKVKKEEEDLKKQEEREAKKEATKQRQEAEREAGKKKK